MDTKTPTPPGWNDPPLMTYQLQDTSKPKPRTLLNKRVAYPVTPANLPSASNSMSLKPTCALPPPLSFSPKLPDVEKETSGSSSEDMLATTLENVNNIINDIADNKKTEILKRVDIMKKMWLENKLNAQVHSQMLKLTEYLNSGDIDSANNIYMSLTIDSAALCSSWMVGIKYLIHHCKSKSS